jgi:hypothetical protein
MYKYIVQFKLLLYKVLFAVAMYSGDRFTKVIVNRKSKITLKISLRARIRAFH